MSEVQRNRDFAQEVKARVNEYFEENRSRATPMRP
jgi:hypothetical protein